MSTQCRAASCTDQDIEPSVKMKFMNNGQFQLQKHCAISRVHIRLQHAGKELQPQRRAADQRPRGSSVRAGQTLHATEHGTGQQSLRNWREDACWTHSIHADCDHDELDRDVHAGKQAVDKA